MFQNPVLLSKIKSTVLAVVGCLIVLQFYPLRAAAVPSSCVDLFSTQNHRNRELVRQAREFENALRRLPRSGTVEFRQLVADIQSQMNQTRSFAAVDLSPWLPAGVREMLFKFQSSGYEISPSGNNSYSRSSPIGRRMDDFAAEYSQWVRELVSDAFPALQTQPNIQTDTRQYCTPVASRGGEVNEKPHIDGGILNTVLTFHGPGTRVLNSFGSNGRVQRFSLEELNMLRRDSFSDADAIAIQPGQLLILAGRDNPTLDAPLHWRPPNSGPRLTWVVQFFSR